MIYPSSPAFSRLTLTSVEPTAVSRAHNGRRLVRKLGGHSWQLTADYPDMTAAQFRPINAFVMALRGRAGSFTIVPPDLATPRGVGGGAPVVAGASQVGSTLAVSGAPASTAGWLKGGDVLTVAGGSKVYMLTADADTDATGAVTLQISPDLVASPADGAVLTISGVAFTMALSRDPVQYIAKPGGMFSFRVEMEEDY